MKVVLKNSEYKTKNIYLIDGSKTLIIVYGGTGDLYWIIQDKNCLNNEEDDCNYFEITQENYAVYSLFEQLVDDIKNINIFDKPIYPFFIESGLSEEEPLEELEKQRYRKYNVSYYNDLYDEQSAVITWVSDETAFEVANKVQIRQGEDKFTIEFSTQTYIEGYERENNTLGTIGIRFRNSGSRYEPFNIVFMRMFYELQKIDDVDDYGHQMHIGEYLYKKSLVKKIPEN